MTLGTKIVAIDYEVATNTIKNDDLTNILDTSDEWISSRTGIKERRVLSPNETSTDLGIKVAQKTIKRANYQGDEFDMIIAASSAPEEVFPSVACRIQAAIGAKKAACFDLKAACAGFIYALNTAHAFIKSGLYKNILIVATDATTKFTDWEDRSICVLFGDGAGCAIVKADENKNDIIGIDLMANGSCGDYITLTTKGTHCPLVQEEKTQTKPFIQMKGKDVYKFVMTEIPPKLEELMSKTNKTIDDIDYFIPHQSNQRMIDALAQRLKIEDSKVISNIENYGNMSAASILVAIREAIDTKKIQLPATVMLSAFGAGMTAGNAILNLDENI
ncbi:MAG: ketoacyl-ACP synthase III [Candidatus Gastranaerophilales bacterium]|nr:ketoacyl-ACP synthase III [Candidatus Gastranaerophilales bacterium]